MLTLSFAEGVSPPDASSAREVQTWRDDQGQVCARGFAGPMLRWVDCPRVGVFAFSRSTPAVRAWQASGVSREVVAATFARMLQPLILQAMGWQALHASAVLGGAGLLAFPGLSGSGKSTIAFALGRCGLRQFADDGLVLSVGAGEINGHALQFTPRLRDRAVEHFAAARSESPAAIAGYGAAAPLKAVVLLRQQQGPWRPWRLEPMPPARAFGSLVAHAHCFDMSDRSDARTFVEDYLTIAERVPVHELTYSPDFGGLPEISNALLELARRTGVFDRDPSDVLGMAVS